MQNNTPVGSFRWPSSDNTATSFTLANSGHFSSSNLTNVTEPFPLQGARGVAIQIAGTGDDNDTIDFRVYLVRKTYNGGTWLGYDCELHGAGTATLSQANRPGGIASVGGGQVVERIADTLTWFLAKSDGTATIPANTYGPGVVLEAAYASGASAVHSPANNKVATLYIQEIGGYDGIIVDTKVNGTATKAFAMIARTWTR